MHSLSVPDISLHADQIAAALRESGWIIAPNFLPASQCEALLADCHRHRERFVAAAIGRGVERQRAREQRGDTTLWLCEDVAVQREFLSAMDELRGEINRQLFLGLHDYEAHYAHYAPGAFYRRHLDAFARTSTAANDVKGASAPQRILTSVIYLNTCTGGELVLWSSGQEQRELIRVAPAAGAAVFFLSAEFPHEVLPANTDRYSIAGWFRGR